MKQVAYLQHGAAGEPMRTQEVSLRRIERTGQPARRGPIASHWSVYFDGKWRPVLISSRAPHLYIHAAHTRVPVVIPE